MPTVDNNIEVSIFTIDEDDFFDQYKPFRNPETDEQDAFDGTLFDTDMLTDPRIKFTAQEQPERIWTLVENDDTRSILSGYHLVNRLGYFITSVPRKAGEQITVTIEENN